jgi:hypothetical protein
MSVDAAAKWGEACLFLRRKVEKSMLKSLACFNPLTDLRAATNHRTNSSSDRG